MKFQPLFLVVGFSVGAASSWAQTPPSVGLVPVLPRYEITAVRDKAQAFLLQGAEKRLALVPGGTDVIGTEAFVRGRASNFEDFLRQVTGIHVSSGNAGEASKISMRGSGIQSDEALGVQVLLGGLTYNQADGEANLEELDLSAIQGAEVYRGANALRYGGSVLGGAINLIPKTGRDSPGFQVRTEAGSFGYRRASVGGGYAAATGDVYLSLAGRQMNGFREHSAEKSYTLNANLGFKPTAQAENRIYFGYSDWLRRVPGDVTAEDLAGNPFPANAEAIEGDFRILTRSVRIADRLVFTTPEGETEAGLVYHRRRFLIFDLYESDYRLGVTDAVSTNLGLLFSHAHRGTLGGRSNAWIVGFAPAHEVEHSTNYRNDDGVQDLSLRTASALTRGVNFPVFFEHIFAATDRLSLVTGVQYVWIERKFEDRFWSDDDGDQSARQTFRGFNPKVGLLFQHSATDAFFLNVSRSFQPPSFDDLNPFEEGTNGSTIYTPLDAQKAWTVELGSRGGIGGIEWDAAVYSAWVRNELLELHDAAGRDIGTVNVPHARHQGVELGLDVELFPGRSDGTQLTLRQEYTLNDFRFDDDPVYRNNQIAGLPRHLYQLELTYRHASGFYLGGDVQSSLTGFWADQANRLRAGAYAVTGLKIGYQGPRFSVFFDVRNLSDQRYAAMVKPIGDARASDDEDLAIFAPGRGRSFFAGVSFGW